MVFIKIFFENASVTTKFNKNANTNMKNNNMLMLNDQEYIATVIKDEASRSISFERENTAYKKLTPFIIIIIIIIYKYRK